MPPQNFQTSFIPKKPSVEPEVIKEKVSLGIFGFIGVVVFFISTALALGVYFYDNNLVQQLSDKQAQLNIGRNALESPLIESAKTLGRRITDANEILSNHMIVSPIFEALQLGTLKSVQFNSFSYTTPSTAQDKVMVQMSGVARDYTSIALESDQLAKNKNIQNPIFSGLALDAQTGNVNFTLNFTVGSDLVNFGNHVADYQSAALAVPSVTVTATTTATSTSMMATSTHTQ